MALHWIEGFTVFGTSYAEVAEAIPLRYPDNNLGENLELNLGSTCVAGRSGELAIALQGSERIGTPSLGELATVATGFALYVDVGINSNPINTFLLALRGDGETQVSLHIESDGKLSLYRGTGSPFAETGLIAQTSAGLIEVGHWYFVELKVEVDNSGTYELRVDGVTALSGSADTQGGSNAWADSVRLFGSDTFFGRKYIFDDWWIAGNFLGDCKVKTTFPNGNGDSTDFTPNTGTNYAAVSESPPDGDATYVESDTPGDMDLYTYDPVTFNVVLGIQTNAVVRTTGAPIDAKLSVKSGSTTDDGSAITVSSTDYSMIGRILELNPDTSEPWTAAEVSAAQFGNKAS